MFVMSSFFNFLGPLGLGVILDLYGPRACSVASSLCVVLGSAMFGISSGKVPLFIPGMCLIGTYDAMIHGWCNYSTSTQCFCSMCTHLSFMHTLVHSCIHAAFGGPGVQSAVIHLSNLFPDWKGFTTAIITGAFQLSFFVFYFFDKLWRYSHWDYQALFLWYALLASVNIVIALVMWPDKPYSFFESDQTKLLRHENKASYADLNELHEHHEQEVMHMGLFRMPSMMYHKTKGGQASPAFRSSPALRSPASMTVAAKKPSKDIKDETLWNQVKSPSFIQLSVFFIITTFWANFYIGTMDLQLGDSYSMKEDERSAYGGMFTFIMGMSVLVIPIAGAIMDAAGLPLTSAITILFGAVWVALLLARMEDAILASFVFYAIFRTFLFTFFFAQLADVMGFKFFGMLAGIIFAIGGLLGLVQLYLAKWGK
jgi:MFS family permease